MQPFLHLCIRCHAAVHNDSLDIEIFSLLLSFLCSSRASSYLKLYLRIRISFHLVEVYTLLKSHRFSITLDSVLNFIGC